MSSQVLPPQANPNPAPAALRAWTRLLRAHASTTRLLSADLQQQHGLSVNDYEALLVLSRADGRRMRRVDLARHLLLTPSGVTRLLEGLERAGLVERAACDTDLRVTYARLTDAGAARLEDASPSHVGSVRRLFEEAFPAGELERFVELLGRLPGVGAGEDSCEPG